MGVLAWDRASSGEILAAMEQNMIGQMCLLPERTPGMEVLRLDDVVLVNSGLASNTFNCVVDARLAPEDLEARIHVVLDYFRERDLPFAWWIGPGSRPANLGESLIRAGLPLDEIDVGMAMDLTRLPALHTLGHLSIERVETPGQLRAFASVLASIFEPPDPVVVEFYERAGRSVLDEQSPLRLYLGLLDGDSVATSALFLGAGVAGIYSIATAQEARGQGIGTAMTRRPLQDAALAGYRVAILQASPGGQGIYARIGFKPLGTFRVHQ